MADAPLDKHALESSWTEIARAIHASDRQILIAVTGGGSGAISALLQTPGASRSILAALVPYSETAMVEWLGSATEQACSEPTARIMAMRAFRHARRLAVDADPHRLVGVACTASLASDRPKRGDHRIHIAVQTAATTASFSLTLEKGRRDRAAEETLATDLILRHLAAIVCAGQMADTPAGPTFAENEHGHFDRHDATPALTELLLGTRSQVTLQPGTLTEIFLDTHAAALQSVHPVIFPGAFNPPHDGHLGMAVIAEQRLGRPVAWELSIANVDKPPLDFLAIRDRVAALRLQDAQQNSKRPLVLTHAATFREKAKLFPGATFIVGADTLARIADPRYYHDEAASRDEAIATIVAHQCRFLAFGREFQGQFQAAGDLDLPPALRALCDEVPAAEFREDVSSTKLRTGDGG